VCCIVIGMCPCVATEVKDLYETLIQNDKHHYNMQNPCGKHYQGKLSVAFTYHTNFCRYLGECPCVATETYTTIFMYCSNRVDNLLYGYLDGLCLTDYLFMKPSWHLLQIIHFGLKSVIRNAAVLIHRLMPHVLQL
jgi:hypothetical protein